MFRIDLSGIAEAKTLFAEAEKELPFALALALTWTGQLVKEAEVELMRKKFDRPTPFTLNSLMLSPAKKDRLQAVVWFKFPPRLSQKEHYLVPQVEGGSRDMKRSEQQLGDKYLMPGKWLKLNRYGNIPPSQIVQIVSRLRKFSERGFAMNATKRSLKTNAKPRDYFLIRKEGRNLAPGVWERIPGTKGKGSRVRPILIAGTKPAYSKRFPFYEEGQKVIDANFERLFEMALAYAMSTQVWGR